MSLSKATPQLSARPATRSGSNIGQGSAYIFVRSGATWTLQQKITASDGVASDGFGSNVAISGNTVVVGLFYYADVPSVYVFTRTGATWTQQQKLTASDGANGDQFGTSIAISGDTIIVSAPGDDLVDGSLQNEGSAYVYARLGTVWTHSQNSSQPTRMESFMGTESPFPAIR